MIVSRENQVLKAVRSLRLRNHREAERAFLVEGVRSVEDALLAGGRPRLILLREGAASLTQPVAPDRVRHVEAKLFDSVAETESPQGVLGVFEMPEIAIPNPPDPLFLILDRIADPGNLGTIIRTAAASGVDALFLTPGCVDPFNPKVVRAAMGAHFRLCIAHFDGEAQGMMEQRGLQRVASDASGMISYDEVDWAHGSILIIGSEAHGVSDELRAFASTAAAIPMAAGVESLNAAVATGVFLFEARRQRRTNGRGVRRN